MLRGRACLIKPSLPPNASKAPPTQRKVRLVKRTAKKSRPLLQQVVNMKTVFVRQERMRCTYQLCKCMSREQGKVRLYLQIFQISFFGTAGVPRLVQLIQWRLISMRNFSDKTNTVFPRYFGWCGFTPSGFSFLTITSCILLFLGRGNLFYKNQEQEHQSWPAPQKTSSWVGGVFKNGRIENKLTSTFGGYFGARVTYHP